MTHNMAYSVIIKFLLLALSVCTYSCRLHKPLSAVSGYVNAKQDFTLWPDAGHIPVCWEAFDKPSFAPILSLSEDGLPKAYSVSVGALNAADVRYKFASAEDPSCEGVDGYVSLESSSLVVELGELDAVTLCLEGRNADFVERLKFELRVSDFSLGVDGKGATRIFPPTDESRKVVETKVVAEFARAGLHLTGWQKCEDSSSGIRIKVGYEGLDRTQAIGRMLDGIPSGMYLNWGKSCGKDVSAEQCMTNTALHEMGHAVGLLHEMNRPDHDECKKDQTEGKGEAKALLLGPYDSKSMMSYCRDRNVEVLSDGDVAVLSDYYSKPIATLFGSGAAMSSADDAYFLVGGQGIAAYRMLVTTDARECLVESTYGISQPVSQILTLDLSSLPRSVRVHLCVLGQGAAGEWQPIRSYSSATWMRSEVL
ncbi:MAG: hypothetical protein EOP09_00910 [Proteobacteria bacterium]|nr:MAG: hypothetical protein EOP09_00910 [Pseudomonadota bacterium]